jgi:citrate synthase
MEITMSAKKAPTTSLCHPTADHIEIRGKDLCNELIGKVDFVQMMMFEIFGRMPTPTETAVVNIVMVGIMEHGMTPSSIAARMIYSSGPEAMQGAVAAGILAGGSVLLGTTEQCAQLLTRIVNDPAGVDAAAKREAEAHRAAKKQIPGFGHPWHHPDDPRTLRCFALAKELGLSCKFVDAANALSKAVDAAWGKHLTMNASTAFGALFCEIGIPVDIMRGFVLISRTAGLVAHIREEQQNPVAWDLMKSAEAAVPYSRP